MKLRARRKNHQSAAMLLALGIAGIIVGWRHSGGSYLNRAGWRARVKLQRIVMLLGGSS